VNIDESVAVNFEKPAQSVTLTRDDYNFTNYNTISYSAKFSAAVTGLTAANFSLNTTTTGASIGTPTTEDNITWTVPVNTGTDGSIRLRFVNANGLSTPISNTLPFDGPIYFIDKTKPAVTISAPSVSSIATGTGSVTYTVTFSDTNLDGVELDENGVYLNTTGDAGGQVAVTGSVFTRTITISNITGTGSIGISITANAAYDRPENLSDAAGPSATFAVVGPVTITSISPATGSPTKLTTVNFNFNTSSVITGLTASNFELETDGSIDGATVGTPVADGDNWIIPVNTGTGSGTLVLKLVNTTGLDKDVVNALPVNSGSLTVDKTTLEIGSIVYATTNEDGTKAVAGDVVTMNFTFNEDLLETPVFTIAGVAGHTATKPDCSSYSVSRTIQATDPAGPITFAAQVKDLLGNVVEVNETSTISIVDPGIAATSLTTASNLTNAETIDFLLTLPENVTGFTANNFDLNANTDGATVGTPTADGDNWIIPVNTGSGDGEISLILVKSTGLSKQISNVPLTSSTVTIDKTAPVFSNILFTTSNADPAKAMEGDTITMTLTSSELLDNPTYDDVMIIVGNSWEILENTGGLNYKVTHVIWSSDPDGFINARFNLQDIAGNTTDFSETSSIKYVKPSDNNNLTSLSISPGGLTPAFNSVPGNNYFSYDLRGGAGTVTAVPSSDKATVTVNGNGPVSGNDFAVNLPGSSNLITIRVIAENGAVKTYTIEAHVMGDGNATLTSLELDPNATKKSVSGPNYADYTATVRVSSIKLTPTSNFPGASITVNGESVASGDTSSPIALTVGTNTINTVVTSQNGITTNTYSIVVTRLISNNAILDELVLNPNIYKTGVAGANYRDYVATVSNNTSSLTVAATPQDAGATIKVNDVIVSPGVASAPIALAVGPNTITTVVTAADNETTKTYSIVITRKAGSNALLSTLELDPNIYKIGVTGTNYRDYTATVSSDKNSVKVTATTEDTGATVKINDVALQSGVASAPIALRIGTNTITTVVKAADGVTTKTYSIVITRKAGSNALLSSLVLDPNIYKVGVAGSNYRDYTASVSNKRSAVDVYATPQDPEASVRVNGSDMMPGRSVPVQLVVGPNTINTEVTAADGTKKIYSIVITREPTTT
ncbi:MAG: cadherin-like beta sandwich domain-containing protein, partial [Sphingobacteriales bacterium]